MKGSTRSGCRRGDAPTRSSSSRCVRHKKTDAQTIRQRIAERQLARSLQQRIEAKLKSGTEVLKAPEEPAPAEAASNVIDLMQMLKERLQGRGPQPPKPERSPGRGKPRSR